MSTNHEENLNPEQYWGEAEKLLDQHYRMKRRKRIAVIFLCFLLSSAGLLTVYYNDKQQAREEVHSVPVKTEALAEEKISNSVSSMIEENNVVESGTSNDDAIKNNVKKNVPVKSAIVNKEEKNVVRKEEHSIPVYATVSPVKHKKEKSKEEHEKVVAPSAVQPAVNSSAAPITSVKDDNKTIRENATFISMIGLPVKWSENSASVISSPDSLHLKNKSHWNLIMYNGLAVVHKKLSASSDPVYLKRRTEEEQHVLLPYSGIQFSKSIKDWDIRAGIELAVLGEDVNYSPKSKGSYYNTYEQWQHYQHTVSDTDSTYIFGILYLHTHDVLRTDSLLANKTDTLTGLHDDVSILKANGINRRYIVEFPVEVTWQLSRGRFGAGISAGCAPGMIVKSEGNYLLKDESGIADLSKGTSRQLTFDIRAGLEFSYLLNERWRVMLRPSGRVYLNSVTEKDGAGNKYRSYGVNAGISYRMSY